MNEVAETEVTKAKVTEATKVAETEVKVTKVAEVTVNFYVKHVIILR